MVLFGWLLCLLLVTGTCAAASPGQEYKVVKVDDVSEDYQSGEAAVAGGGDGGDDVAAEGKEDELTTPDQTTSSPHNAENDAEQNRTELTKATSSNEEVVVNVVVDCEDSEFGCCESDYYLVDAANDDNMANSTANSTAAATVTATATTDGAGARRQLRIPLRRPAHGPDALGCCAVSEFGCCPDGRTPAKGPFGEGCDNCSVTAFGCCEDGKTPARGANYEGCGCYQSEHGCCPDFRTAASSSNETEGFGCPCVASRHGCCPDGTSTADGPNLEGCQADCLRSEFGCCPDGVTPKKEEEEDVGCGCEASEFGCCRDGVTVAQGKDFKGCPHPLPGAGCLDPPDTGPCDNYTTRWFYDVEYGGCSRFWFGGCESGRNNFGSEEDCKAQCVHPRGSAVCYLDKVVGPCEGSYEEWYYDSERKDCFPFLYSGCLGNGNRFPKREDCEATCVEEKQAEIPLCELPISEGACDGDFRRWYYNGDSGRCEPFSYSGCRGNANRFLGRAECDRACAHVARKRRTEVVCKMTIGDGRTRTGAETDLEEGGCAAKGGILARWAHDGFRHRCVPFYSLPGCGTSNENSFPSIQECESVCPAAFPPEIKLEEADGETVVRVGETGARVGVRIRASPPARVRWTRVADGEVGEEQQVAPDPRGIEAKTPFSYALEEDGSLLLPSPVGYAESGHYAVWADNGIGSGARREASVVVHPFTPTARMMISDEKRPAPAVASVEPGSDLTLTCAVRAFPPPGEFTWFRGSGEILAGGGGDGGTARKSRFSISTRRRTQTVVDSSLRVRNVTSVDTGRYSCLSGSASAFVWVRVGLGSTGRCVDRGPEVLPGLDCAMVVRQDYCGNRHYARLCCESCSRAGFDPPDSGG